MNKFNVDPANVIIDAEEFSIKEAFRSANENVRVPFNSQWEMNAAYGYFLAGWQAAQRHKPVVTRLHPIEGERSDDLGIVDYE